MSVEIRHVSHQTNNMSTVKKRCADNDRTDLLTIKPSQSQIIQLSVIKPHTRWRSIQNMYQRFHLFYLNLILDLAMFRHNQPNCSPVCATFKGRKHIPAPIWVYTDTQTHTHTLHMQTQTHIHVHTHIHMHLHAHVHMYTHTHIHMHTHTYVHTQTFSLYIYICVKTNFVDFEGFWSILQFHDFCAE